MVAANGRQLSPPLDLADELRAGLAEHRAGDAATAAGRYRRILAVEPRVADALHLLGLLALAAGRPADAVRWIERAVAVEAGAALYWFNLGNAASESGDVEAAARCYERALDLDPGHEGAARNLGGARVRMAALPGAIGRCRARWGTADAARHHPGDERRCATLGPGHLLIRGWGCGFWGEVNHVAVQIAMADVLGREPVVFWGGELRYRPPGLENAWEGYFEPLSRTGIDDLEHARPTCFPGQWRAETLRSTRVLPLRTSAQINPFGVTALAAINRPEPVVVADGYNEMSDVLA